MKMKRVSNLELQKQIIKLDGKISVLFSLMERMENVICQVYSTDAKSAERNRQRTRETYKNATEVLQEFYKQVDDAFGGESDGNGKL